MTIPRPRTVRAKLTLFTMLVTGVLLGLIILVVDLGARRTLIGAVDGELLRLANRIEGRPRGGPGGPDGRGPGGPGGRRGPPPDVDDPNALRPIDILIDPPAGFRNPVPYDVRTAALAKQGMASFSEFERGGTTYRLYSFPIRRGGRIDEVVQAPTPLTNVLDSLAGLRRTLLQVVLPVGVLLAGLASLLLVDRFMRPLKRMAEEAERIGATDLGARLPVVGEDEVAGLAGTLNGMLGRLETAFAQERRELERQRGFTADASHELKTPLAVIKANAGLMLHVDGTKEEVRSWTGEIDAAANRMTRLVNDMLMLARAESGTKARKHERCDLRDVAEGARRQLAVGAERLIVLAGAEPVPILGSCEDLTRVVMNLAGNALTHSGASAPVEIAVAREGQDAVLTVTDQGKGIAAEHLPRLFDRFYRVDASRSSATGGTGLGLAIVKGVVQAHEGTISVESRVGAGTRFAVRLPLA